MENNIIKNQILRILPTSIGSVIEKAIENMWNCVEEIRIYYPGSLWIKISNTSFNISNDSKLNIKPLNPYITEKNILESIINNASKMSPDAFEYHLKRGYVTIDGGHRIGFCGNTIIKNNEVATINCINTVVIRVCKNKVLYDNCVFEDLFTEKCPSNICIISPPGCGKTTFLRNFIFYISNKLNWLNICVVDERCEIINSNINYNNVSIVYGMPKKFATETVIKCMSPDLIVYDEIYSNEEFECIKKANSSGVFCAFSLHGKSIENLINNGINIKSLCNSQVIAVELSKNRGCGTIESIRRI